MEFTILESDSINFTRGSLPIRTDHSFVKKQDAEYFTAIQFTKADPRIFPADFSIYICNRGIRSYNHTDFSGRIVPWQQFCGEYLEHGALTLRKPEHKIEIVLGITAPDGKFKAFMDDSYFDRTNSGLKVQNYNAIPDFYLTLDYTLFKERKP